MAKKDTSNPIVSPLIKFNEFHDNLLKEGYDIPDKGTFFKDMGDENKRKELHDNLLKEGYDLPDFNTFSSDLGFPQKKKISSSVSKPSVTPSPSIKKELEKLPKVGGFEQKVPVTERPLKKTVVPTMEEIEKSVPERVRQLKYYGQTVKVGDQEVPAIKQVKGVKLSEYLNQYGLSPKDVGETQDRFIGKEDVNKFDTLQKAIQYKYLSLNAKDEDLDTKEDDSPFVRQAKLAGIKAKTERESSTLSKYAIGGTSAVMGGINDMVIKPAMGLADMLEDLQGLGMVAGQMRKEAGLPQVHPVTGLIKGASKALFKDWEETKAKIPELPETTMGKVVGGFATLPGMMLSFAGTPEVKLGQVGMKLASNMALVAFGDAYKTATDENKPILDKFTEAAKQGYEGGKEGLMMEGIMWAGSGEHALKSMAVNAAGFGGLDVYDQFNQTGNVDWHSAVGSAIFGGALGAKGGKYKPEGIQILPKRLNDALTNYFTTPKESGKTLSALGLSLSEIRKKVDDLRESVIPDSKVKIEENPDGTQNVNIDVDPEKLTTEDINKLSQAQALSNMGDRMAVEQAMLDRPSEAKDAINSDNTLSDEQKKIAIGKIDESISNNDPVNQQTSTIAYEIHQLEDQKAKIQEEDIDDKVKESKSKFIDDQIKEKTKQIDDIIRGVTPTEVPKEEAKEFEPEEAKPETIGDKKAVKPKPITESEPIKALDQAKAQGKKIYTDFDDTLFNTKTGELTELGKKMKKRMAEDKSITVLTHRPKEETAQIKKLLDIDDSRIKSGLSPEGKAKYAKDGVLFDDKKENRDAVIKAGGEAVEIKPEAEKEPISGLTEEENKKDIIREINSKPLTHAEGLGMGQNEMEGTYISTEKDNRYSKGAKHVKADVKNPYVLKDANELVDLQNSILGKAKENYIKYHPEAKKDIENAKSFDDDVFANYPDFQDYVAKEVTSKLKSKGYDSAYLRETKDSEGMLVVFDKSQISGIEKETTEKEKQGEVFEVPLSKIKTDTKRFQNRTELDKEQVKNIAENWDRNQLDPIVLWKDSKGNTFLLAGHHRLEAAKIRKEKSIPSRYFKGTEEEAVRYARELSNANRRMETPVERASIYHKMRQEGKKRSEIQEALKIEGKNKTLIENISYLNPNGKIVSMLKSFTASGDTKTIRLTEQVADWIGSVRKFYPELTNAHEDELYDWLINKNAIDKIRTKTDLQMRLSRVIDMVRLNPDEPINIESKITKGYLQTEKENEIQNVKTKIKDLEKERDKEKPGKQRLTEITNEIGKQNKILGELNRQLKEAIAGDKAQGSLFDQISNDINKNVRNGNITDEEASEFIGSRENAKSDEPIIKDIESKANSTKESELNQSIKEAEKQLKPEDYAIKEGKIKEGDKQQHKGDNAQLPPEGHDRDIKPEVEQGRAEAGDRDRLLEGKEKEKINTIADIVGKIRNLDEESTKKLLDNITNKYNDVKKRFGDKRASKLLDDELKRAKKLSGTDKKDSQILKSSILMGGEKYLIKFGERDVIPKTEKALKTIKETLRNAKEIFAPYAMGEHAQTAKRVMRFRMGELAHKTELIYQSLKKIGDYFEGMSNDYNLRLIDSGERGEFTFGSKEDKEIIRMLQGLLRDKYTFLQENYLKDTKSYGEFIENFFPHIWESPEKAEQVIASLMNPKGSLEGFPKFLKQRTIEFTMDGIKKGLVPVTYNPVEMVMLKMYEMDRFMMGHDVLNDFKKRGLLKFIKKGDKIPDGYSKIDDRMTKKYGKYDVGDKTIIRELGNYVMPKEAATIVNNYLSKGFSATKLAGVYRGIRYAENTLNQAQLGLSMFHLGFTTSDVMISKTALALMELSQGKFLSATKDILSLPVTPITNMLKGEALRSSAYGLESKIDKVLRATGLVSHNFSLHGDMTWAVNDLVKAGGRTIQGREYTNEDRKGFIKEWKVDNKPGAILRLPSAIIEGFAKPLMEDIVPLQKLGVFVDLAKNINAEAARKGWTEEQRVDRLQEAWDSVDNRMGQIVYDNLFWDKTFKDLMMVTFRSVGWNWGSIRELGGAPIDLAIEGYKKITGKQARVTPKMAYAVALPLTTGLVGAIISYMYTGKAPDDRKGYWFIKTGYKNEDGTDERVSLPTYMKDAVSYYSEIGQTLKNKLNPLWSVADQIWNNKDFPGYEIYDSNDPIYKNIMDIAEYTAKQFVPFSITTAQQRARAKEPLSRQIQSFFGITPAPKYITNTKAQKEIGELYTKRFGGASKPKSQRDVDQWKKDIVSLMKDGDKEGAETKLQEGVEKGYVKEANKNRQFQSLTKRVTGAFDEFAFKRLSNIDKASLLSNPKQFDDEAFKKYYPIAGAIHDTNIPQELIDAIEERRNKLKVEQNVAKVRTTRGIGKIGPKFTFPKF